MERKRHIRYIVLNVIAMLLFGNACTFDDAKEDISGSMQDVIVKLSGAGFSCKSTDPDEFRVCDVSLMVFDEYGSIEEYRWIDSKVQNLSEGIKLRLTAGKRYSFYGCVNFGYKVYADNVEELDEVRFHMAYPDEFWNGIPMCIMEKDILIEKDCDSIVLEIKRLMSKISLSIDRSKLDGDVRMNVIGARIGNCPKVVTVFSDSRISSHSECFTAGYDKNEFETDQMNISDRHGISGEVSLYMLENMQGELTDKDQQREFDEGDIRAGICSYIELDIEYLSSRTASWSSPLRYRFYLGENAKDSNVERNCHYHMRICPDKDGLSKDGWSIDKSGLCKFVQEIRLSQKELSFEYEGQTFLLESSILPQDATLQIPIWESSNVRVATVSDTGMVTATGEGKCTITCISQDGAGARASCEVRCEFKDAWLKLYPGSIISGNVGDRIHVWCEFFPPSAPFDLGYEELEYDRARGIYDYEVDEDGHGVTLILRKPGSGLLYMSAGYPINDSVMATVVVNQM